VGIDPMSFLWDEIEAYQRLGEETYNEIVNAPKNSIRDIMKGLNAEVNGNYPIAENMMNHSIESKGDIGFSSSSPIAKALARSEEFFRLIEDSASSSIQTVIRFRSDPNLSRSLHDCTLIGELNVVEQKYNFVGNAKDRYDFRFDWLPSEWTWRGVGLRLAGNLARACTEVGLMGAFDISVDLEFEGTK